MLGHLGLKAIEPLGTEWQLSLFILSAVLAWGGPQAHALGPLPTQFILGLKCACERTCVPGRICHWTPSPICSYDTLEETWHCEEVTSAVVFKRTLCSLSYRTSTYAKLRGAIYMLWFKVVRECEVWLTALSPKLPRSTSAAIEVWAIRPEPDTLSQDSSWPWAQLQGKPSTASGHTSEKQNSSSRQTCQVALTIKADLKSLSRTSQSQGRACPMRTDSQACWLLLYPTPLNHVSVNQEGSADSTLSGTTTKEWK